MGVGNFLPSKPGMVTVWLLVCFEEGVGDVAEELQSSNLGALRKGGSRGLAHGRTSAESRTSLQIRDVR
jgi:hypothetical protein